MRRLLLAGSGYGKEPSPLPDRERRKELTIREPTDDERRRLEQAKRCWRGAPTFEEARRSADADVVRWEWWTWSVRDVPEPYYAQRNRFPVGRRIKEEPGEPIELSRYGFDDQGRMRAACLFGALAELTKFVVSEYGEPGLRQYRYDERQELVSVRLYELEEERVRWSVSYSESEGKRWTFQDFTYDEAGLPLRLSTWGFDEGEGEERTRLRSAGGVEVFEHDDRGRLLRVTAGSQLRDEPKYVLFRRRAQGVSIRQLEQRVLERLSQALPAAAAAAADLEEPVWCLALLYDPGAPLPPSAHLGSEHERRAWGWELNPAEWDAWEPPRRVELQDPDVDEVCTALSSEWAARDTGPEPARRLLNRLAGQLNELDWTKFAPATDDFFVYAVDLELEELSGNLERGVPKSLLKRLRKEGLED